jgi:hypothetical protein
VKLGKKNKSRKIERLPVGIFFYLSPSSWSGSSRAVGCLGVFLEDFRGIAVNDEIRTWNLAPLPGVRPFWYTFHRRSANPLSGVLVRTSRTLPSSSPSSDPDALNHSPLSAHYPLLHRYDDKTATN